MTRGQFDNRAIDWLARGLRPVANATSPFYRRYPYRGGLWISEIDLRIAVCPEFRFVFNRLPKVANSSVTTALARAVQDRLGASDASAKRYFRRPSRLGRATVRAMDDWLWFAFVRNPFTRVLSAYLDKVAGRKRQATRLFRRLGHPPAGPVVDFPAFCRYLDDGGLMDDNHWAPQTDGLLRPAAAFGFLGRFETLDADFGRLHARLFDSEAPRIGVAGPPPTRADRRLADHYTPEAVEIVRRLYASDFESFTYSRDLPEGNDGGRRLDNIDAAH